MMKAVLPLLEEGEYLAKKRASRWAVFTAKQLYDYVLSIARVINYKRPNLKPRKPPVLSKDKIVELKAQGRIIEKK